MSLQIHAKNLRHAERVPMQSEVVVMDDDRETVLGYAIDMSLKGMRLEGDKPLPPRRRFHFRLEFESPSPKGPAPVSVVVYGICVRCEEISFRDEYESGVLFELVTGTTREGLKELLARAR